METEPPEEIATCSSDQHISSADEVAEATTSTNINIDDAAATNEQFSPEFLQRKLYFLLEHLKEMHGELPE